MDRLQKKALDENLFFLQENLVLTESVSALLIQHGIFSDDMIHAIQSQPTPQAKIRELLQTLKKRNHASFDVFLDVLRKTSQEHLADKLSECLTEKIMMRGNSPATERVKEFIHKNFVQNRKFSHSDTRMAVDNLVLRSDLVEETEGKEQALRQCQQLHEIIHRRDEELQDLRAKLDFYFRDNQEQLAKLRHSEEEVMRLKKRVSESDSLPQVPKSAGLQRSSSQSSETRRSPDYDVRQLLKQKDDLLKKKDEEYNELKSILETTQNDLQSVLDLNNQYLLIISQLNELQIANAAKAKVEKQDTSDLELQLEESQEKVIELNESLEKANTRLEVKEAELGQVLEREAKYKELLGLNPRASEQQVEAKIQEIRESGAMNRHELERVRKELVNTRMSKNQLEEQVISVTREKEQVEFHLRQQDLTIKRMMRMKSARDTITNAQAVLGGQIRSAKASFPPVGTSASVVEISPAQLKLQMAEASSALINQYCVLCKTEIRSEKQANTACRFHHKALRNAKWVCCKDECHRSAGCLHTTHFYVETTRDNEAFLTNGVDRVQLK